MYKGETLEQAFRPDLICYGLVVVALKAVKEVADVHRAQLFNSLKGTELRLGMLVVVGDNPKATVDRVVL